MRLADGWSTLLFGMVILKHGNLQKEQLQSWQARLISVIFQSLIMFDFIDRTEINVV